MADRSTSKSKRRGVVRTTAAGADEAMLLAENARLTAELAQARSHIAQLEQKHAEIINRIDWVIDSLHNLSE